MEPSEIAMALLGYVFFIPLLTFHEWAHAWTAMKCGDNTARDLGRVSLNPIVHMEVIGTVVLPLLGIFLSLSGSGLAGFIIGWGKPVPVDLNNLSKPRMHDTLISMAGPAMNVLLAIPLVIVAVLAVRFGNESVSEIAIRIAELSLFLCFFNLLPIPPLDGSHAMQHIVGMSWETYQRIARSGFILVIIANPGRPQSRRGRHGNDVDRDDPGRKLGVQLNGLPGKNLAGFRIRALLICRSQTKHSPN